MPSSGPSDPTSTVEVTNPGWPGSRVELGDPVDRYIPVDEIGAGGMGIVYLAYDPKLDRRVALKVLWPGRDNAEGTERLIREAQAMAQLAHPNVVPVYDVGIAGDRAFIAMEYVRGGSLQQWLRKQPRDWRAIVDAFVHAGRGLAAAHRLGLIHRDFKADNVLVADSGRILVTDFGLVREREAPIDERSDPSARLVAGSSRLTQTHGTVGTLSYMAPEQHRGSDVDERADQFSFCAALFEALFGTRPFQAASPEALTSAKLAGTMVPTPSGAEVPARIRRAIVRGLAADASDRWPAMDPLLDVLGRPRRRYGTAIAAVAVVTLGAGATAAILATGGPDPCRDADRRADRVWNDDRADTLRTALTAVDVPYAAATAGHVTSLLDEFVDGWVPRYRQACYALESGRDVLRRDAQLVCLRQQLTRVDALVEVLQTADVAAIEKVAAAAESLPRPQRCHDARASELESLAPVPATELEATQRLIARARAELIAGDYERGRTVAQEALAAATVSGSELLRAEAGVALGQAHRQLAQFDLARQHLEDAYHAARSVGADSVALAAATKLLLTHGFDLAQIEVAASWQRHGQSIVSAARIHGRMEIDLYKAQAAVALRAGRRDDAVQFARRSVQLQRDFGDAGSLDEASVLEIMGRAQTGAGQLEAARDSFRACRDLRVAILGPEHPGVAVAKTNYATALARTGQRGLGRAELEDALSIQSRALGPDHPRVGRIVANLANYHSADGDHEAALRRNHEALRIFRTAFGPRHFEVMTAEANLGHALLNMDRGAEAQPHFEAAVAIADRLPRVDPSRIAAARVGLGQALALTGQRRAALTELRVARTLVADVPDRLALVHAMIGELELEFEDYEAARASFARAATLRPIGSPGWREPQWGLARVAWHADGDASRARALAQRLVDHPSAIARGEPSLDEVVAWVSKLPAKSR